MSAARKSRAAAEGLVEGRRHFAEVRRIALRNPGAARATIRRMLLPSEWTAESSNARAGFIEALAHAAIAHVCRPMAPRAFNSQTFRGVRS